LVTPPPPGSSRGSESLAARPPLPIIKKKALRPLITRPPAPTSNQLQCLKHLLTSNQQRATGLHAATGGNRIRRKMTAKTSHRQRPITTTIQQRVPAPASLPVYPHPATFDQKSMPPLGSSVLSTPNSPIFRVTF